MGKFVEVISFQSGILAGFELTDGEIESRSRKKDGKAMVRFNSSIARSKRTLIRVVNSNEDLRTFITLTFRDEVTNLKDANDEWKKFTKRLGRRHHAGIQKLKWVVGREFMENGRVHFHALTNIRWIDKAELEALWGHGWVDIKTVYDRGGLGWYFGKYLTKDGFAPENRIWTCSRNCVRPRIVDEEEEQEIILSGKLERRFFQVMNIEGIGEVESVKYERTEEWQGVNPSRCSDGS